MPMDARISRFSALHAFSLDVGFVIETGEMEQAMHGQMRKWWMGGLASCAASRMTVS